MRCRCRPSFVRATLSGLAAIFFVILVLIVLLLSPSIIEGPGNVHYLIKTRCVVNNINYLTNYCPRDSSNDIFALIYQTEWEKCLVIRMDIQALDKGILCTYFWPESFTDETDALISVSQKFQNGTEFDCVIDTIHQNCYPDKNEVYVFIGVVTGVFVIFLIFFSIYLHLEIKDRKLKKEMSLGKKNDR